LFRVKILTISDSASQGKRKDSAGPLIEELLRLTGKFSVEETDVVPDEADQIAERIRTWADSGSCDLIVTTGGTGLSPRDVTPEATLQVLDRQIPGMAEAMRLEGMKNTSRAMLSRAVCGTRRNTLIINLPGSRGGVTDGLSALAEVLEHAIRKTQGDTAPCGD